MAPDRSEAIWARAVEAGARGRYAEAEVLVSPLASADNRWSSLGLSLMASHRRQVGATGEALRMDAQALRHADDAEARADALIGLAADAVASGDLESAVSWHDEAAADAAQEWRTLTRWHWVGAERALLAGEAVLAAHHAQQARDACAGRSLRHETKTSIILAAATGRVDALLDLGTVVRAEGWTTLAWPLALVAADHGDHLPSDGLAEAWEAGRGATYEIEHGLPESLLPVWRDHPGVRRLRADGPPIRGG